MRYNKEDTPATRPCVSRATAYTRADHDAVAARTHVEFTRLVPATNVQLVPVGVYPRSG